MQRSKVYLNRRQSRMVDELAMKRGIPGLALMENAGKGCTLQLFERGVKSAVICCGTGNNGGDGFVIARRMATGGVPVKIVLCGSAAELQGDAQVNYSIICQLNLKIAELDLGVGQGQIRSLLETVDETPAEWIVDCLLGTGASGDPRSPMKEVIEVANALPCKRLAVDLPSGLDCDTGEPGNPTFRADLTCTFVAKKIGFTNPLATEYLGEVRVISIGVPLEMLEEVCRETP